MVIRWGRRYSAVTILREGVQEGADEGYIESDAKTVKGVEYAKCMQQFCLFHAIFPQLALVVVTSPATSCSPACWVICGLL
jgi:hypothetical protein